MNLAHYYKAISTELHGSFGHLLLSGDMSGKRATWSIKAIGDYTANGVNVVEFPQFIRASVRNEGGQKWLRIRIKTPFATKFFTLPVIHISLAAEESLLRSIVLVALEMWQEAQPDCVADVRTHDLDAAQLVRVTGTIPCRDESLGTVYVPVHAPSNVLLEREVGCVAVAHDSAEIRYDVVMYRPGTEIDADADADEADSPEDSDVDAPTSPEMRGDNNDGFCHVCMHEIDSTGKCFCGDHEDIQPV